MDPFYHDANPYGLGARDFAIRRLQGWSPPAAPPEPRVVVPPAPQRHYYAPAEEYRTQRRLEFCRHLYQSGRLQP